MSCNGCGAEPAMTKTQVENLINQYINEGKLQTGLLNCDGDSISAGVNKVVLCSALTDLVLDAIKRGDIAVLTDLTVDTNGGLVLTDGTGAEKTIATPFVYDINYDPLTNKVSWYVNGAEKSATLPYAKATVSGNELIVKTADGDVVQLILDAISAADAKGIIADLINDGTLQAGLTDCDGNSISKQGAVVLCTALAGKVNELISDGTIDVVTDVTINDKGQLVVTDGTGKTTTVNTPFVKDLEFDSTTNVLSWTENGTAKSETLPYVKAVVGSEQVVFTLPDGSTTAVPTMDNAIAGGFDITIQKGASFTDKYGLNMLKNGGLDYDKTGGVYVKTGAGIKLDSDGNVATDVTTLTKNDLKVLLQALNDNGLLGDGLGLGSNGELVVKTESVTQADGATHWFYAVNK